MYLLLDHLTRVRISSRGYPQIVFKNTYYSVGFKKTQNNLSIKIPVRQVPLQAEQELAAHPGAGQARHRHTQLSQRGSEASLPWHGPR